MAARGRPTKILTTEDLIELEKFLADLHYLKKNQQQATMLLHSKEFHELDEKDLSLLKSYIVKKFSLNKGKHSLNKSS